MKPTIRGVSNVALLLGVILPGLAASSRANVPGYEKTEFMVPMRDRVRLHTLVYRPAKAAGPLPIMLMRTPYGVDAGGPHRWRIPQGPRGRRLRLRVPGHPGQVQVRGDIRHDPSSPKDRRSQGHRRGDRRLRHDRLAGQERQGEQWPGGDAGDFLPGLAHGHGPAGAAPRAKAASPQASPADMFLGDDFHHNGAFRLSYGFEYAALMETSKENSPFAFDRRDTFEWYLRLGPLSNANALYLKGKIPTWNDFVEHSSYDEFWCKQAAAPYLGRPRVPRSTSPDGGTRRISSVRSKSTNRSRRATRSGGTSWWSGRGTTAAGRMARETGWAR